MPQVLAILEEYYVNGDIQDAATTLQARHIAPGMFVVHTGMFVLHTGVEIAQIALMASFKPPTLPLSLVTACIA